MFKIRHKTTGLFSNGHRYYATVSYGNGIYGWSEEGKVWMSKQSLLTFINAYMKFDKDGLTGVGSISPEWEVVELEYKIINTEKANMYYLENSTKFQRKKKRK